MKDRVENIAPSDDFSKWPVYSDEEIQAVESVLRSGMVNYWTGNEIRHFEKEYADYVGMPHGIAVANGTVALELALHALGITEGDDVIVTSRSFVASASCVALCGARPVFADVDRESQNITASSMEAALTSNTKAIILVHLAGWPCEMDEILSLAKGKNIKIIEDCAQAHGANYKGQPVGSFGDAAAFSFCQDKIISTGGEGGMLLVRNDDVFSRAWSYKDHGKSYNMAYNNKYTSEFSWLHKSFGTNWRMTEMQAAIGRIQLRKLNDWVHTRQSNAYVLNEGFADLPGIRITVPADYMEHAYYKYYIFINLEILKSSWSRTRIIESIVERNIPCSTGSCGEIYMEESFQSSGYSPVERFSTAKELGETSLVFPVHPSLTFENMTNIVSVVQDVVGSAIKV